MILCCTKMQAELRADVVLCVLDNVPFTGRKQPPVAYLQSDQGHAGLVPIAYCPFCGGEIAVVEAAI